MTTTPTQRRLYVSMITSLDGYIEGPNRELDWFQDGNPQFEQYCDEMIDSVGVAVYGRTSYCDEMIDSVGVAVYGRTSYELMLQYWPDAEVRARSPQDLAFARKMNALPKVVLSRTLAHAAWANTRVARDPEEIAELKRQPGKPIVAWAGAALVSTLIAHRLVDELRLVVHPVVLGGGTPLFARRDRRLELRQIRTQNLGGGLSVLCYEPAWS